MGSLDTISLQEIMFSTKSTRHSNLNKSKTFTRTSTRTMQLFHKARISYISVERVMVVIAAELQNLMALKKSGSSSGF